VTASNRRILDRIALISDVHGNLTALEAVLDDIDARGITRIFNLGDYVGKGPRGREVIDACRQRCEVNLLGNWDDDLPNPDSRFQSPFSLQFVRVPYDVESELAVARAMGMPELDAYASELRHGIYRGEMNDPDGPKYHRRSRVPVPA
jgi:hypothetical protein